MKNKSLIYGVGINDADYVVSTADSTTVNGKRKFYNFRRCPYYTVWLEMLRRGHSDKEKSRHGSYKDVTVCKEWHLFSNFKAWMEQQDWEGKQLDKDILIRGNRVYSPEACCFVPSQINCCLLDSKGSRGEYPLGVCLITGAENRVNRYKSEGAILQGKRNRVHIGVFPTPQKAHRAWQLAKAEYLEKVVELWYSGDYGTFLPNIADALIYRAWQLRLDAMNGVETVII